MVLRRQKGNPLEQILQVLTREDVAQMQAEAAQVYISPELVDYMIRLITATRTHPNILRGASPRATIAVTAMSRALAYLQRRDYVLPEDIQAVFPEVVDHRLLLPGDAAARVTGFITRWRWWPPPFATSCTKSGSPGFS